MVDENLVEALKQVQREGLRQMAADMPEFRPYLPAFESCGVSLVEAEMVAAAQAWGEVAKAAVAAGCSPEKMDATDVTRLVSYQLSHIAFTYLCALFGSPEMIPRAAGAHLIKMFAGKLGDFFDTPASEQVYITPDGKVRPAGGGGSNSVN